MDPVAPTEGLAERREVVLAAQLDTPTRSRLAVTKELGASGARLLSMGRFQPGEVVVLWMLVAGTHSKVRAEGRVVRAEPFNVSGPWRCLLTVDFDEPLDEESAALLLSGDPGE